MLVTVNVLCLFLTVPWVGLQFVFVVFPDHTHLLFQLNNVNSSSLLQEELYILTDFSISVTFFHRFVGVTEMEKSV